MKDSLKAKNRESIKLLQIKAETDKDMITDSAVAWSDQRLYNKVVKSFLFSWWSTLGLYTLCCAIAINSVVAAALRFSSLIRLNYV